MSLKRSKRPPLSRCPGCSGLRLVEHCQTRGFTEYTRGTTFPTQHRRTPEAAQKEWEQACRQRWRALALAIKAKLEVVEAGISTFDAEFLAQMVLPDGSTFGAWAEPELVRVYETSTMPAMLALGSGS